MKKIQRMLSAMFQKSPKS
uniref:Uncharacterized protein n=1 Tax=Arundo donax TaxID=35708 RepID=A0A0A9C856_ARUDO